MLRGGGRQEVRSDAVWLNLPGDPRQKPRCQLFLKFSVSELKWRPWSGAGDHAWGSSFKPRLVCPPEWSVPPDCCAVHCVRCFQCLAPNAGVFQKWMKCSFPCMIFKKTYSGMVLPAQPFQAAREAVQCWCRERHVDTSWWHLLREIFQIKGWRVRSSPNVSLGTCGT